MKQKPNQLDALIVFAGALVVSVASAQYRPADPVGLGDQGADASASFARISIEGLDSQPGVFDPADVDVEFTPLSHNLEARSTEDVPDGFRLVEGDILIPIGPEGSQGQGVAAASNLWPSGIVYYVFDSAVTTGNRNAMLAAMAEWEAVADIDFRARTSQTNYIYIRNSSGNSSSVGRIGGRQYVNIYNWNFRFIMCHELAHALGLWHEQSRPDRNTYVEIITSNIEAGHEHNFEIHSNANTIGPYDFESIMHYGSCAFSECSGCSSSCYTIRARPAYASQQSLMGNRDHLSTGDIAGMQALYGAPPAPLVPDLVLEEIIFANTTIDLNQTVEAQLRVANRGTGAAGAFDVSVWLDSPPVFCPAVRTTIAGLAAGATMTLNVINISYSTEGMKTFSAYVDVCNDVSESDGSNNTGSVTLDVFDFPQLDTPVVTSATAGERSIAMQWNTVAGATGYKVYYDEDSSNPPFSPDSLALEGTSGLDVGNVTNFTLTGLPAGQIYYVAVKAYDSFSESPYSNQLTATPYTLIPNAPVLASATGGDRTVTLQWNSVAGADGYRVYYDEDTTNPPYSPLTPAAEGVTAIDAGNSTQFTLTGFPSNHQTRVAVTAYNVHGESDFSNEIAAQTIANIPAAPNLTSVVGGANSITVSWQSVSGATGYRVYYDEDASNPPYTPANTATQGNSPVNAGNVTSLKLTGLSAGTRYYAAVTAFNADGESGYSNERSDRTSNPPPPPPPPSSSTGSSGSGSGGGGSNPPPAGSTTTTGSGSCTILCGLFPCNNLMLMAVGMAGIYRLRRRNRVRRLR